MARTGRPRGFDREAGLDAAMRVFWQHGYEGSSIEALRAAIGNISSASLYAAYGSKEDLYRQALDRYQASHGQVMSSLFDASLPPRDRIERTLRAAARMQSDPDHPLGCMVTMSAMVGSPQTDDLRRNAAMLRRANREAIGRAVQEAVADGTLRDDAAAKGLPVLLDMVLNGLTLVARDGVDGGMLDGAIDALMARWDGSEPR